ncbi:hypothetical protein [Halorubellus sp. PRR65]|uniref:hypothetical protein n=1 Tax=Halorubellus sp. PRR65 TaxID=3098148 RepID=UPI002B25F038|nr:hypothetical protein [Halorubellus sp. PRR65]
MCPQQRRDLLALAGAAATTLAAGCLATDEGESPTTSSDDDGTTTTDGPADTTAGTGGATATVDGEFAAATWLPAPDALEAEAFFVFAGDLDAPRDAGVGARALQRTYTTMVPVPDDVLDGDDVTEFASLQGYATACRYDAPTTEVRDALASLAAAAGPTATAGEGTSAASMTEDEATDDGARSQPTGDAPDGYEGYVTDDGVCWLGADHLLFGRHRRLVAAMSDAREGDVDRYASNADLAAVLDATGDVDLVGATATSHQVVSSASAYAYGWRFDDRVDLVASFAFEDAAATDADAVASLGERAGFAEYEHGDVTTDGRVATFTGDLPVADFDLLKRDDGGRTATANRGGMPQVSFAFDAELGDDGEWDGDDDERVVVTHHGGDHVDLANVALRYEGSDVADTDAFASTRPPGDTWTAGGEWTLRAATADATFESDATVQVVWTSDGGDRSAVLAMFELP